MKANRRRFLQGTAVVGGGLAIGIGYLSRGQTVDYVARWGESGDFMPTAQLRITPDNRVVFTLARVEMGQGTQTSQTMLIGEQLKIDPNLIEVCPAPNHADFASPGLGIQATGGSSSTRTSFSVLSQAGAMAREALLSAASIRLGVPTSKLEIKGKAIVYENETLSFGQLASDAVAHLNEDAPLIPRSQYQYIGREGQRRLDAPEKVTGEAKYAADITLPDLEVAVMIQGPLDATLLEIDAEAAKKVGGIKLIERTPYGVAVIADRYYQARKAADALKLKWSDSTFSTEQMWLRFAERMSLDEGLDRVREEGDVSAIFKEKERTLDVEYQLPFLAHMTMEPQVCTAWVRSDQIEVWAPTQGPRQVAIAAAEVVNRDESDVLVHNTTIGGSFGRRMETDYVRQAVYLSQLRKRPVRLQWSREDDVQHDFYRPASLHRLRATVGEGSVEAWEHRIVQPSAMSRSVKSIFKELVSPMFIGPAAWAFSTFLDDGSIVEGAKGLPYGIPNIAVGYHVANEPVPVGAWRSVGHSSNGFVVESFIDECAHAAQRDPVEFRRQLLAEHPRHLGVLEKVTSEAHWGQALPEGYAQGIAVHKSFGTYVAIVAEVSVEGKDIRIHRLTAAVDCGLAIYPDGVKAQIEGAMIYGLSTAFGPAEITYKEGRVQQSNFHDFAALRYIDCPDISVTIIDSEESPSGAGEPGLPPTLAAVGNAIYAATGKRLRKVPFVV